MNRAASHTAYRHLLVASIIGGTALMANATEYIQNGNFEQNTATSTTSDHTFMYYNPNQPTNKDSIVDWSISNEDHVVVEYLNNQSATRANGAWYTKTPNRAYALPSSFEDVSSVKGDTLQPGAVQADPDGGYFIGVDGNVKGHPGASYIYQTVTGLMPGQAYTLTFDWAAIQLNAKTGPTTEAWEVSFGSAPTVGQTQSTATVAECTHCFSGWMKASMTFVADSANEVLTFASFGSPAGGPPMTLLDGVSLTEVSGGAVTAPVPEPSSWMLMLAGFASIGRYVQTRRRSKRPEGVTN